MAFRHRFVARLAWRTAALFGATVLAAVLAVWGQAPVATLLVGLGVAVALASLWSVVDEGNATLARFVTALDCGDLTQSFARTDRNTGFGRVGDAYERALARLRDERTERVGSARFAEALADSAPVALLVLDPDDRVTFANKAARRLFGRAGDAPLNALAAFGATFAADVAAAMPGSSRLSQLVGDGIPQRVSLDATVLDIGGVRRRIVAVRIVQPELDRAELAAQVDLVRVLTHEIMNSLTPVVSLSATANRTVAGLDPSLAPGIGDAQLALAALARRAAELERFVESYKGFSEAPAIVRKPFVVAEWLGRVVRLFEATPLSADIAVTVEIAPGTPQLDGDAALLTQMLLNLLKNAAEAVAGGGNPRIRITAAPFGDGWIKLDVIDTGAGIPPHLRGEVFLPFFTTKRTGTGIGLSFARQIVLLHGGQIGFHDGLPSRLELTLPAADCRADCPG